MFIVAAPGVEAVLAKEVRALPGAQDVKAVPGGVELRGTLEVLYRALPELSRTVPGLRVVVAGAPVEGYEPPEPPSLPNVEVVQHLQKIETPMLRRLFQEASLVVVPYVEASQSGVIQTAYAFGKPVVASSVGGLPEAVQQSVTGLLVPPGDAGALAGAISQLLCDERMRQSMSDSIRDLEATTLGWGAVARAIYRVYDATAAGVA